MNDNELTAITIRLPATMRDEIKNSAEAENRSITGFVRHHLGPVIAAAHVRRLEDEAAADILRNSLPVEHEAAPDVPQSLLDTTLPPLMGGVLK